VPGKAIVLIVHVSGGDNTGMDFVGVLVYVVNSLIVLFLLLIDLG
jgi:hypothetical protein